MKISCEEKIILLRHYLPFVYLLEAQSVLRTDYNKINEHNCKRKYNVFIYVYVLRCNMQFPCLLNNFCISNYTLFLSNSI